MTPINGSLYTVNPIAVNSAIDVFGENKRVITVLDTPAFGKVVAVSVGATMVGSIVHVVDQGAHTLPRLAGLLDWVFLSDSPPPRPSACRS